MEDIQEQIDAYDMLAARLREEEREQFSIDEQATLLVETFAARKKFFTAQRAAEIRNKPPTKSQLKNKMVTYLKHMGRYTHNQLKNKNFEEIHKLYEREKKWIDDFKPMDTEVFKDSGKKDDSSSKPAGGGRKKTLARKREGAKQSKESAKKQKLEDVAEEQVFAKSDEKVAADYEHEKEELRMWLIVVSDEKRLWIQRFCLLDGNTSYQKSLSGMLRKFNRQDLVDLHILMMKRFEDTTLEGYNLLLWGDLKSSYIADGWYFDLLQYASREKVSSHQRNAVEDVELEAKS
ncbi:hypothetical protein Tco_0444663 [Tanacetum coccineum]